MDMLFAFVLFLTGGDLTPFTTFVSSVQDTFSTLLTTLFG